MRCAEREAGSRINSEIAKMGMDRATASGAAKEQAIYAVGIGGGGYGRWDVKVRRACAMR